MCTSLLMKATSIRFFVSKNSNCGLQLVWIIANSRKISEYWMKSPPNSCIYSWFHCAASLNKDLKMYYHHHLILFYFFIFMELTTFAISSTIDSMTWKWLFQWLELAYTWFCYIDITNCTSVLIVSWNHPFPSLVMLELILQNQLFWLCCFSE